MEYYSKNAEVQSGAVEITLENHLEHVFLLYLLLYNATMRRLKVLLGILLILLVLQGVALFMLGLVVYQSTPNSILARQTIIGRMPGLLSMVRLVDRAGNVFYRGPTTKGHLPRYSLNIAPEDWDKIIKNIPTELPSSSYGNLFLTDDAKVWVDGDFIHDGKEYDVKVRVRGDLFNHWAYRKKSLRIKFDKDNLFRGMREINLIIPEDRGWIAEPFNAYRAEKFGLFYPPVSFVQLSLNGSAFMSYTQIEHWTKEMLEKQGRPGDVNIYKTGGGTSSFQQWDAVFNDIAYWDKYEESSSSLDSYEEIALLQKLSISGAHTDPAYIDNLGNVMDIDKILSWYTVSLLSGSRHIRDHNVRFFFDTTRGLLEPLPWDIGLYAPRSLFSPPGNPFLNEVFALPELKLEAHRMVWEYIANEEEVQKDLEYAKELRARIERPTYRDPIKLMSNRQVKKELDTKMSLIERNIKFLKEELSVSEVLVTQSVSKSSDSDRGLLLTLDLTSRGTATAVLSGASVPLPLAQEIEDGTVRLLRDNGDDVWGDSDQVVPLSVSQDLDKNDRRVLTVSDETNALLWPGEPVIGEGESVVSIPHARHRFFLVRTGGTISISDEDLPLKLKIRNAVTGKKAQVIADALIDNRTFESLGEASVDRDTFLKTHSPFRADGADGVMLSGNVRLTNTVIIPSSLRLSILPGTVLSLGKDVSLLSYSPVTVIGTPRSPIRFQSASSDPWGVFAVLNAKEPSTVAWSEFSDGSEAQINGTFFSGMVSFYDSSVSITDSLFMNAYGDDGLNLKYVHTDVQRSRFRDNFADGLDIDNSPSGTLRDSVFLFNGNDGVDISWSPINIRNVTIEDSEDKCISVGERSKPFIENTTVKGCAIGLAVKDGSEVTAKDVTFLDNEIAVSGYIKKPIFSSPSATIINSTFVGNGKDIQEGSGSTITLEDSF
jgi:hypothetical protein